MDDQTNKPQDQEQTLPLTDDTQTATTSPDNNDAIVLLNLEDLIKNNVTRIEALQNEMREQKEMLENVLINDATYREHTEAAKEAAKIKSQTRAQIMKQPSVMQVANKAKEMKMELSEIQSSLSEYLAEYQRLAKTNILLDNDGEEREIVSVCKLVKRGSKKGQ